MVGSEQKFILGKHTGRKGLEYILTTLGYSPTPNEIDVILERIKSISETKQTITQDVLLAVISETRQETELQNTSGSDKARTG